MNALHPYDRDIPEQKDETEEDQTGENQESDEDSLLGFNVQSFLQKDVTGDSSIVKEKNGFKKRTPISYKSPIISTRHGINERLFLRGRDGRKGIPGWSFSFSPLIGSL